MALGKGNIEIDIKGNVDTSGIARQVAAAEKQIRPLSVSLNEKGFRQPLGKISGDLAEFQKSLDASVARTLAFGAAVGVINSVSDAFGALVTSAVEVEKALTDINVILNLNGEALRQFSDELFEVAANTGQSFQTVAEAAVELSRQGLGAEETLKRINDAMILSRLSGMDAAKSVETLTAAVNSFGEAALTTTDLVNKLATVDAAFAVSTEDLANALARAGSTAQAAKVDLNELLAAVTSVQQTTARGGSVIGNAFKSIFTRIQRSGVRAALEEIGVATTDAAGNIRGALDILQDYAGVYTSLTDSQRAYTDELVAGVFQINNLRALVKDLSGDYSIYQRALDQSNNATDEAIRRNEQLQDTLSALINEAAVNAKELAATLGSLAATPAIENLLNIFNSISGALKTALDPEEGSGLIQGLITGIGKFISGPGLIIIGAAFIKLFKFITQQSLKAVSEIFKIGSAANKVADAEAKIGFLLKNNQALYEAISNEALTHEQREELVLNTIKQQNAAYKQQQALISRLAGARSIQSAVSPTSQAAGFIPTASEGLMPKGKKPQEKNTKIKTNASGFIPNFANNIQGAIEAERQAVSSGVGGASSSARPTVLRNFPMGGGRYETVVANTDEVIVPKFGGGTGSAIFNQDMIKQFGMPEGAKAVSRGYIPNYAQSQLRGNKAFQGLLSEFRGVDVDVQKDISGFGMLSAKGRRANLDVTKKPGFSKEQKINIMNTIGGSKLAKEDINYLLTTIGDKKKTRFSNIPAQTIESASPEQFKGKVGALDNLINPYIANAVADVATNVYTTVLGDEVRAQNLVKNVRAAANADKGIISVGAQGDIFESAIRLGSQESAKGLAKDDRSAIWDFEESSSISPDLKSLFFPSSSIVKADAKRIGDQGSAVEVVNKAYKDTFDEQLKNIYARSWAPIVDAAAKSAPAKQKTERKRTGTNFASGFIPNFITNIPTEAIKPFQPEDAKKPTKKIYQPNDIKKFSKLTQEQQKKFKKDVSSDQLKSFLLSKLREKSWFGFINDNFVNRNTQWPQRHYPDILTKDFSDRKSTFDIQGSRAGYIYSNKAGTPDWKTKISGIVKQKKSRSAIAPKLEQQISDAFYGFDFVSITPPEAKQTQIKYDVLRGRLDEASKEIFKANDSKDVNIAKILDIDDEIFPQTGAKLDDDWRANFRKIVNNNKQYYLDRLTEYNKKQKDPAQAQRTKAQVTGRIFEELINSAQKAVIEETGYLSQLDTQNWDYYSLTGKEKEVLGISSDFGDYKTSIDNGTNEKSFIKKFIREPFGKNAARGFIPSFAESLIPEVANQVPPTMNFDSGFIPNFVGNKIKWDIDKKTNDYSLSGNETDLRLFGNYLKQVSEVDPKIVTPKAAKIFEERVEKVRFEKTQEDKDFKSKNEIGFGRQGAKYYSGREAVRDKDRKVSTKGLFIKQLGEHVRNHNRNGILAAKDAPFLFNKARGHMPNFIEGFVPNFANQVFDSDRMPRSFSNQVLQDILANKKKKDLIIGPSGAGKSTIASKYGEFIQSIEDVEEATSFTLLSGAGKTKAGGLSPALLKVIESVNETGGKVSYLSVKDEDIAKRREKRIKQPIRGDVRSEAQLKGAKHAPLNQKGFPEMVKKAANRFEILTAGSGYIPNFALPEKDFAKFSTAIARFNAKNAINPPLKALSSRELFKIPKRDPQIAEETVQSIRQFISSDEYRFLNGDTQKQIKKFYNTFAAKTGLSDPTREFTKYENAEFEGRIAAAKGLMPNFIDETITASTGKKDPVQSIAETRKNPRDRVSNAISEYVNKKQMLGAEQAQAFDAQYQMDAKASGSIPNFAIPQKDFTKFSTAISKFNSKNAVSPPLQASNAQELFKIAQTSPDSKEETVRNINQFIDSEEYKSLNKDTQQQIKKFYSSFTSKTKPADAARKFAKYEDPGFEVGPTAFKGLIPNFIDETAGSKAGKKNLSQAVTEDRKNPRDRVSKAISEYVNKKQMLGAEQAQTFDAQYQMDAKASGSIPNFAIPQKDFTKFSTAISKFNSKNAVSPPLQASNAQELFKVAQTSPDSKEETVRNINQFIDSEEYKSLNKDTQQQIKKFYSSFTSKTKPADAARKFAKYEDPGFEVGTTAFKGLIPNFIDETAGSKAGKKNLSQAVTEDRKNPRDQVSKAISEYVNKKQMLGAEQAQTFDAQYQMDAKASGSIPNFAIPQKDFTKFSTAISKFNSKNAVSPPLQASNAQELFKVAQTSPDSKEETVRNINQFIDSEEYKSLNKDTQQQIKKFYSSFTSKTKPADAARKFAKYEDPGFEVGPTAFKGLIPNFIDETAGSKAGKKNLSQAVTEDRKNPRDRVSKAISEYVNKKQMLGAEQAQTFDAQYQMDAKASGSIPNFAIPQKDFTKFSTAISKFNSKNAVSPPLQASNAQELFKVAQTSPDSKEETVRNINQFIDSEEYKSLNKDTQQQIKKFYSSFTSKTKPADAARKFAKYEDPGFEVGPIASKGFVPKAIEKTIRERSIKEESLSPENKSSKKFSAISKFVESSGIQDSQLFSHQPPLPEQRDNNLEKRKQFLDAAKGMVPNFVKDKKQAYVFDFDDTLAVTQAKGFKDFSDPKFIESAEATRYSSLARRRAKLGDDIHVLTARIGSKGITSAISDFMKNIGAPAKSVIGVADMFKNEKEEGAKPGKIRKMGTAGKKSKILSQLSKQYEAITFLDDSNENILKAQEVPGVKAIQAKKDKLFKADGLIPNFALTSSMIKGLQAKLKPGSGATEAEKKSAREKLQKEGIISDDKIRGIKDAAILGDLKFSRKQVQNAIADVVDKRNRLELDPQPIEVDTADSLRFANEYIKKVNSNKSTFLNEKIFDTPLNTAEVSMALKGQGGYKRGKYFPEKIARNRAEGYIPHFIQPKEKDSPKNVKSYISGYIPNFADALQQAIVREKDALRSQGSNAKVYVDKDRRLKSPKNPMGLLVANKRDEPAGGFQGVNRAISTGLDPKTHGMASGYIPNYITAPRQEEAIKGLKNVNLKNLADGIEGVRNKSAETTPELKKQSDSTDEVSQAAGSSFGKMIAIQMALTTLETTLIQTGAVAEDFSLKFTQLGFAVGEGFDSIGDTLEGFKATKKLGANVKKFAGALGIASAAAGVAYDMYKNFFDAEQNSIRALDQEIKTREKMLNVISQNIESIDQFATSAARFSKTTETGNVETAGKFMQELFTKAKDLGELDVNAFDKVIQSLGDAQKLNVAVDAFKKTAAAGKDLKVVENDFANMVKSFKQQIDENQVLGIFGDETGAGINTQQFEDQFKSIGATLTKNLSDDKIVELSSALEGFDTSAGNSGQAMIRLQSIFGKFDNSTRKLLLGNEKLTAGLLQQIKEQTRYSSAVIKAKQAFEVSAQPITVLNTRLSELGNQLIATAQSTSFAIETIAQTGKIEAESNIKSLQAAGTVSQPNLIAGQAAADIKNIIAQSAKQQEMALKTFAGQVIKENKEGTTTLDSGVKNLIEQISSGNLSNEAALKSLMEIQKTGSPEQKDAATKTIEELKKINQSTLKDTQVTNANLRAQLAQYRNQVVSFQRNNQLSDNQLKLLGNFDNAFKQGNQEGLQIAKSTLERIGELNQAVSTIESLGGDPDILAELKESNSKLSQLENLKAAFSSLTGAEFDAGSLDQLLTQAIDFDLTGLDSQVSSLFIGLIDGVKTAIQSREDAGVKTAADVEQASLIKFEDAQINSLSTAMGQAVSNALASALGIGPEIASEVNKAVDVNLVARAIEELVTKNAQNALINAETMKDLNQALISSLKEADFGTSSTSLEKAAMSLEKAAQTINTKFSAEGFVPNYAPTSPVNRALQTERAMGAKKPVVDSHPSIGTYVRDGATQPNFAAVKRDHPEGISKASQNSRVIQSTTKAKGFVPNFASFYVNDAYNKLGGDLTGIDSGAPSADLRIARLDKAILNKKGDFSSYFDGWNAEKIADEFEARPLRAMFAAVSPLAALLGVKNINSQDVDRQSPPSLKRTYFRYAANDSDPNDYPALINIGDLYAKAKKAFSAENLFESEFNEKIARHNPYTKSEYLESLNPSIQDQAMTGEITKRINSQEKNFQKEFAGRGDQVLPTDENFIANSWWKNNGRREIFYQNAGIPIQKFDQIKKEVDELYNKPYSPAPDYNVFDKLKEVFETKHLKAKGYSWADFSNAKYGFIRKEDAAFDDTKLKKLMAGQGVYSHTDDNLLNIAEGPEFLLRRQVAGQLRGLHGGLINNSQKISIPFGIDENGLISENIIGDYTLGEFAGIGDYIRQAIATEQSRETPNRNLIDNYNAQLEKYQEKVKFFNKDIYLRDTEDFVTAPSYFDLSSKKGVTIDSENADKWSDFPVSRFNYKESLGNIQEPTTPQQDGEQRFSDFKNELVKKLDSAKNLSDVTKYLKERYAAETKKALFSLQAKKGKQSYTDVIDRVKAQQSSVKSEIEFLENKEDKTPEEEARLTQLNKNKSIIETTTAGDKETGVIPSLEEEQEKITTEISGAKETAQQGLQVEQEEIKTNAEQERDKLYTALLGKEVEQQRTSSPAQEFSDRINKALGFSGRYVNYIDKLIKSRQQSLQREQKTKGGSPTIIARAENAIAKLNEMKAIYSDPELMPAYHLNTEWGTNPVRVPGFEIPLEGLVDRKFLWESSPNYLQEYKAKREEYDLDNFKADDALGGKQTREQLLADYKDRGLLNRDPSIGLYAQIQRTEANSPQRFLKIFENADLAKRKALLNSIGADMSTPVEDKDLNAMDFAKVVTDFASSARDNTLGFLFKEMNLSKAENALPFKKYFIDKTREIGIPFNHIKSVDSFLKPRTVEVISDKAKSAPVKAIDDSSVDTLISNLIDTQIRDYNNLSEGDKTPSVFESLFDQNLNETQLLDYPVYLNYLIDNKNATLARQKITSLLDQTDGIEVEAWQQKYANQAFLKQYTEGEYAKIGSMKLKEDAIDPDGLGANSVVTRLNDANEVYNPFNINGQFNQNITPREAMQNIVAGKYHAINPGIEELLNNNVHPFNVVELPSVIKENFTFSAEEAAKKLAESQKEYIKKQKKNYAPYGYTIDGGFKRETPVGMPDLIPQLAKAYKGVQKNEQEPDKEAARGFVPNFSAIAGEIAASRTAGYKNPVTPSQVKTMSIPGVGKTAYNTQESVFKLPGTTQPFIVPPSSSKAAKPYAREVQNKYNFNPYKKTAADGFVPNFMAGTDFSAFEIAVSSFSNIINSLGSTITSFNDGVNSFGQIFEGLNFTDISKASKEIYDAARIFSAQSTIFKDAASLIKNGAELLSSGGQQNQAGASPELNFDALDTAANTFTSAVQSLSTNISKPLSIDDANMIKSMNALQSSLSQINGNINLTIPDIRVNINGTNVTSDIRAIIESEIPRIVQSEIAKLNLNEKIKTSIFG